ncbi:hypothetical protein ACQCN2_12435 [Brevibacillus ginsengisoli]|uniref:hypothetical protein n=1 Tax=Brevibacillus ginsengisoli TaxID=363854 RepID=UPI003CE926C1
MANHNNHAFPPEYKPGAGMKDNAQLGVWLGLISALFLIATFVSSNVYLRGWSPEVFALKYQTDLPYQSTLTLLIGAVMAIFTGNAFRNRKDGMFAAGLFVSLMLFAASFVQECLLIKEMAALGPAAWTAYVTVYVCQAIMLLISVILFVVAVAFQLRRNEQALKRFIPASMSVWLFTLMLGLGILLLTNVMSVEQFTEWCGVKFLGLVK